MRYFSGKSLYGGKYVAIHPKHRKFEILFEFGSKEDAKRYYKTLDFENQKMYLRRIKIFFCRHKDEYELDVGSKLYHYSYCPKCSRAIYVNDETEKEREIRIREAVKFSRRNEIKELEELIEYQTNKLARLKEEFKHEYEENNNEFKSRGKICCSRI